MILDADFKIVFRFFPEHQVVEIISIWYFQVKIARL